MNRKDEHLSLAKASHKEKGNDFGCVRLVRQSFVESAVNEVDISTSFLSFQLPQPFYVNAMIGGSQRAKEINQRLDIIGEETGLLVAIGSVSAALRDASLADTYQIIRKESPDGLISADIDAGLDMEETKRVLDLFQANALQIHVNMPQELVVPEGDRDFTNWLTKTEAIVQTVEMPVIVKEVGFGTSQETSEKPAFISVQAANVSGQGEVNFTQIEDARREKCELSFLDDWGQSTATSPLES